MKSSQWGWSGGGMKAAYSTDLLSESILKYSLDYTSDSLEKWKTKYNFNLISTWVYSFSGNYKFFGKALALKKFDFHTWGLEQVQTQTHDSGELEAMDYLWITLSWWPSKKKFKPKGEKISFFVSTNNNNYNNNTQRKNNNTEIYTNQPLSCLICPVDQYQLASEKATIMIYSANSVQTDLEKLLDWDLYCIPLSFWICSEV